VGVGFPGAHAVRTACGAGGHAEVAGEPGTHVLPESGNFGLHHYATPPPLRRDAMFWVHLLMECDMSAGRFPALRKSKWAVWQWSLA